MANTGRPAANEYNEYYGRYISLVPEDDIRAAVEEQSRETAALLATIDERKADFRYAPDKWSIKQLVGHVADSERIFAYRVLCIARGETKPLPGFDQDEFMRDANFDSRPFASILDEYRTARASSLAMLRGLPDEAWKRMGTASGNPVSARAVAYTLLGHERHHLNVLRERYLQSAT